jgi:5S rRNA maturation endonuclease (ribonuclease M5)/archaellum biogenesis ATPase FlaH
VDKQEIINRLDVNAFYSSELPSFKVNGSGMGQSLCPFHNDTKPSLTVNLSTGQFKCFGCNKRGSIFDFYMTKHGVDYRLAFNALAKEAGLSIETQKRIIKTTYDYTAEQGNLLFQTVRYEPKDFKQRRPDGKGSWIWSLTENKRFVIPLVPYNLQEVVKAKSIIIVEGEKDVEALKGIGLIASCNPMGAGKWRPEYNRYFKGKRVAIIPDNDRAGHDHAQTIAKNLKEIAESVKVIELPGLTEKGDTSDWLIQGHTKEELIEIIKDTPEWIPEEPKSLLSSLLKWNDILTLDVKTEYILEKLIPKSSITLLFGRGGIGKTSLCMQIARVIANGIPFDTLQTIQSPVYYIDFENPLAVLKERVEKIGKSENLYVWHISNEIQPPKLDSNGWDLYKQLPPGLLVIDTLRASHLSDENDSKPMSMIMGRLKELREMGFTILLLHHTPKGNDNIFKGSTALLDLCDHVLGLEEVKDYDGETLEFDCQNLYRVGTRIKTRYDPYQIYLTFKPEMKGFSVAVDPDIEKMEGIYKMLRQSSEPLKQKELREQVKNDMDLHDKEVRRLLKKGTGLYWNIEKGNKNATLYIPLDSVFQFVNPIYTRQTEKQESPQPESLTNRPLSDTNQSIDNTEFGSLSGGIEQTEKQAKCDPCNRFDSCMMSEGQKQLCGGPF